ncbi:flagellar motor switch protein G [Variovorax paradoxus]|jgi:flagellar motor switch protein FliG|uniref:flagellar motor switch protein FliG n=1 Tax=Variovorax TaxID=34072 RepID=UPI0006E6FBBA|nr:MULTISPECIES: flagellar motor switch protein FliG [unclassified Variovorax]KPU93915.1 flagellar motor switch protein G [Variovorax paradoxus]KPU99764.1 flagellar motor switch protein G [Variovorax paradoxus]KPV08236.1 flagellar motor switch protein G [Variovorax paradoxus]KPV13256.1 flagellar motor switch protein G [Variovorax paradoxus]KPV20585.1 flagellar motor switch protein G [Variovorax paradoxus]
MDEQGLNDAAILLMSLGEQEAGEVLRHLSPREVQKIGETIAKTRAVSRERLGEVADRFITATAGQSLFAADTGDYVRSVMRHALGEEKASILVDRILQTADLSGIENLKWMDAPSVAEVLKLEHPQIVAAILVHLEPEHASAILLQLPDLQRAEVLLRVATLEGIQPAALEDLNEVMFRVLSGGAKVRKPSLGGPRTAAGMINLLGSGADAQAIAAIRNHDAELAQQIADLTFVFDDVMKLDDKSLQLVMKEIASETLIVALKGAAPPLRDKFLSNMSSRAAEALREDLEARGPLRLSEVEAQQKEILKALRRLADEGQIMLGGGDGGFV